MPTSINLNPLDPQNQDVFLEVSDQRKFKSLKVKENRLLNRDSHV